MSSWPCPACNIRTVPTFFRSCFINVVMLFDCPQIKMIHSTWCCSTYLWGARYMLLNFQLWSSFKMFEKQMQGVHLWNPWFFFFFFQNYAQWLVAVSVNIILSNKQRDIWLSVCTLCQRRKSLSSLFSSTSEVPITKIHTSIWQKSKTQEKQSGNSFRNQFIKYSNTTEEKCPWENSLKRYST